MKVILVSLSLTPIPTNGRMKGSTVMRYPKHQEARQKQILSLGVDVSVRFHVYTHVCPPF